MENNSSFNPQIEESLASNFSFLNLQQLKNPSEFSSNYYSLLVKLHSLIFENVPFAKIRQFVEENQLQVNDVDCFGCSALHYAALSPEKNGDKEYSRNKEMIVGYLLSKKALPFQPQKIISQVIILKNKGSFFKLMLLPIFRKVMIEKRSVTLF